MTIKRDGVAAVGAGVLRDRGAELHGGAAARRGRDRVQRASDPTSGVTGCTVSGHGAALGPHTLTATATNGAGLTSTATLAYTVVAPTLTPAISALSAAKVRMKVSTITRFGLKATVKAAAAKTKLIDHGDAAGPPGRLPDEDRRQGHCEADRSACTRTGRARLRARPGDLTLKVVGSAAGHRTTTLTAKVKTKR